MSQKLYNEFRGKKWAKFQTNAQKSPNAILFERFGDPCRKREICRSQGAVHVVTCSASPKVILTSLITVLL